MLPRYLNGRRSADDGFAAMSGTLVSATVVQLWRAAPRVARDGNSLGHRLSRTAQERTE